MAISAALAEHSSLADLCAVKEAVGAVEQQRWGLHPAQRTALPCCLASACSQPTPSAVECWQQQLKASEQLASFVAALRLSMR